MQICSRLAISLTRARLARVAQPLAPSSPRPRDGWVTVVEAANHRVERHGRSLWVSVWRRPDLDMATGAALAQALVSTVLGKLAELAGPGSLRVVVLDLRQAPPVNGPSTQQSVGRLLAACEQAGVIPAFLHAGEGLAALQLGRLVREYAPRLGQVTQDVEAAEALTSNVESRR